MDTAPLNLPRDKEHMILEAAQKRFAVFGFTKVTMDEIAADIGMGKASLYYYFPTKEDLYRAVILREQGEFLTAAHEILGQSLPAAEKLRLYADQRHEYFRRLLNLQVLCQTHYFSPKPVFVELFESFAGKELALLTELVREGQRNEEFQTHQPEAMARLALHVLQGLRMREMRAMHWAQFGEDETGQLEEDTSAFIEVLIRALAKPKHVPTTREKFPG